MTIQELVAEVTPSIAIGDFESVFHRLLQTILEEREEIISYYHYRGEFVPTDVGFQTKRPDIILVLTKSRIHKIVIEIKDGERQVFHTDSYFLTDIASYSVEASLMRDSEGSWLAVGKFSLSFPNGERIELRFDKVTEENPLEKFVQSVLSTLASLS